VQHSVCGVGFLCLEAEHLRPGSDGKVVGDLLLWCWEGMCGSQAQTQRQTDSVSLSAPSGLYQALHQ
jgi:hypothetical protein